MSRKEENGIVVEYRMPNVPEGLKLSGSIRKSFKEEVTTDDLLAETIERMHVLISKIEVDGIVVEYGDLIKSKKSKNILIQIADEVIGDLFLDEEKKSE